MGVDLRRIGRKRTLGLPDAVRLVLLLAIASALVWLVPQSPAKGAILMILLGLPLVLGLVPRNWLYGMRTPRTMFSSEEVWYIQNWITGVAMLVIGIVWAIVLVTR